MKKPDDTTRLEHMFESANDAISFLGSMSEAELCENRMVLHAIVRSVEIIGEAASQISRSYRDKHSEIPWLNIIGMRNRLVHAYFDIDHEVVYSTVREDIPVLAEQVRKLLSEFK